MWQESWPIDQGGDHWSRLFWWADLRDLSSLLKAISFLCHLSYRPVYSLGDLFRYFPCGVYYCFVHWELLPRQAGTRATTATTTGKIGCIKQCSSSTGNVRTGWKLFSVLRGTVACPSKFWYPSIEGTMRPVWWMITKRHVGTMTHYSTVDVNDRLRVARRFGATNGCLPGRKNDSFHTKDLILPILVPSCRCRHCRQRSRLFECK